MPLIAVLPGPSALASPVRSALADPLPAPAGRRTPVIALPPPVALTFPVPIALSPVTDGAAGGAKTTQASAMTPVAHWIDPATNWPTSGPPSSQYKGVKAIPATATIPVAIFHRCETRTPDPPHGAWQSGTNTRQTAES